MTKSNRIRLSLVLYMNYFIHGIGLLILTQNMKALSGVWGTPLATVSYVISGVGIGRLLAYYLFGSLSDRYGRKVFIAIGMVSYTVFFIGIVLTRDFQIAYLLAILAGIANSALDSGTYPTFMELGGNNGAANILIKAAMSVGEFILPLFIGLNENLGGWYGLSFVLAAAILLVNCLVLIRTRFPEQPRPVGKADHRLFEKGTVTARKVGLLAILSLYGYTSMALMILYTQWITLYGIGDLHMSNIQAHFLLSLYSAGSITGVLITFILLKRAMVKDIHLILTLSGLAFLALLVVCFSGNPLVVSVASFIFGVTAAGGIMQVGLNIFISLFPKARGRVTGIFFSFGSLASFTVPIFTGMLSTISTAAALRSDLIIAAASCVLWLTGYRLMRSSTGENMSYRKERSRINLIDSLILRLLQWRFRMVRAIGVKKRDQEGQIFDQAREQEIMNRIYRQIRDHENVAYYQAIFQTILTNSKRYQSQIQEKGRIR